MQRIDTSAILSWFEKASMVVPQTGTIYPDGGGHFALGSPDGRVLKQDEAIEFSVGGQWILGFVEYDHNGDYLRAANGACICGLHAGMHIRLRALNQQAMCVH